MVERAAWSTFDAKPGCKAEINAILQQGRDGVAQEPGTTTSVAPKTGPGCHATFAAAALDAHVHRPIADAVCQRAAGKPLESNFTLIDHTGQLHTEPWGDKRTYDYAAPLGVEQP